MFSNWSSISAFDEIQILFLACLSTGMILAAVDNRLRSLITHNWKSLAVLILLCLVWRVSVFISPFYGLEYEDSYVYTVSALSPTDTLATQQGESRFLTRTCVIGNLATCELREISPGHYIGWPAILRVASRVFSHSAVLPLYVNLLGSCVSVVCIYLLCILLLTKEIAWCSSVLFAITPVFAVNGMAAYAEPVSNTFMSLAALWYVRYLYADHDTTLCEVLNWCALTFTLLLLVLIKRENIILLLAFPLLSFVGKWTQITPLPSATKIANSFMICAAVFVCSIFSLGVFGSLMHESHEFGQFSFSVVNVVQLIPSFLICVANPEWYGFTALMVLIGILIAYRTKSALLLIIALLLAYVALYLSHLHGYYQIHGGTVAPAGHLRFLANCMTWWSIVAGAGLASVLQWLSSRQRSRRRTMVILCSVYSVACFTITEDYRQEASANEFESRIAPALAANAVAQAADKPMYVVTLEPLIIEMFGSSSTRILGLYIVNDDVLKQLCTADPRTEILVVKQSQYEGEGSITRYARNWASLDRLEQKTVYSSATFSLIKAPCRE